MRFSDKNWGLEDKQRGWQREQGDARFEPVRGQQGPRAASGAHS